MKNIKNQLKSALFESKNSKGTILGNRWYTKNIKNQLKSAYCCLCADVLCNEQKLKYQK